VRIMDKLLSATVMMLAFSVGLHRHTDLAIPLVPAEWPSDTPIGLGIRQEKLSNTVGDLHRFGNAKCLIHMAPYRPLGSTNEIECLGGPAKRTFRALGTQSEPLRGARAKCRGQMSHRPLEARNDFSGRHHRLLLVPCHGPVDLRVLRTGPRTVTQREPPFDRPVGMPSGALSTVSARPVSSSVKAKTDRAKTCRASNGLQRRQHS
jgi:hypothetical protein